MKTQRVQEQQEPAHPLVFSTHPAFTEAFGTTPQSLEAVLQANIGTIPYISATTAQEVYLVQETKRVLTDSTGLKEISVRSHFRSFAESESVPTHTLFFDMRQHFPLAKATLEPAEEASCKPLARSHPEYFSLSALTLASQEGVIIPTTSAHVHTLVRKLRPLSIRGTAANPANGVYLPGTLGLGFVYAHPQIMQKSDGEYLILTHSALAYAQRPFENEREVFCFTERGFELMKTRRVPYDSTLDPISESIYKHLHEPMEAQGSRFVQKIVQRTPLPRLNLEKIVRHIDYLKNVDGVRHYREFYAAQPVA